MSRNWRCQADANALASVKVIDPAERGRWHIVKCGGSLRPGILDLSARGRTYIAAQFGMRHGVGSLKHTNGHPIRGTRTLNCGLKAEYVRWKKKRVAAEDS